jgi:hypothetical protein
LLADYDLAWTDSPRARQIYHAAALDEARRSASLREVWGLAFLYNLTLKPVSTPQLWAEVTAFVRCWSAPCPPLSGEAVGEPEVRDLVERWRPGLSAARTASLATSDFVLRQWVWLAALGVLATAGVVFVPALRPLTPGVLFWWAVVVSTSAMAMPCERYVIVTEPILYAVAMATLGVLVRRGAGAVARGQAPVPAIADGDAVADQYARPTRRSATT